MLGPLDLSHNDIAQIMSEVLDKPVRFRQFAADETFKARLLQSGRSEAMTQGYLDMWTAYDQGLTTDEPRTPEGTTPTSFRQWYEDVLGPTV
jgi:hypothetical protein